MDLANIIIIAGSVVTASGVIVGAVKKILDKAMQPVMKRIDCMDVRQCRMWLVDFLTDVERGIEKDEVQYKFAHDCYDHYTDDLKQNSYVKDKWERVMK